MSLNSLKINPRAARSLSEVSSPCALSSTLSSPSETLATSSSIYATFKILQLVNTFRKRVKTRVHSAKKELSKEVAKSFCLDFEREAYDEIDNYLGRKQVHRPSKGRNVATAIATERVTWSRINLLLDHINQVVKSETNSLVTVAASDKLFFQRRAEFTFWLEYLSQKQLIALLVVVKDLLNTIRPGCPSERGAKTLCEGNEVLDQQIEELDQTYLANLEHLLRCLKDQLLRSLIGRLNGDNRNYIFECQHDQTKRREEWFFEFPDARHPLNTTFPWNIKPSLAVLWGVCWMFYDYYNDNNSSNFPPDESADDSLRAWWPFDDQGNMVNEQGGVVTEPYVQDEYFQRAIQRPQPQGYNRQVTNSQAFGFGPRQAQARNFLVPSGPAPHLQRGVSLTLSAMGGSPHHVPSSPAGANPHVARPAAGTAVVGTNNSPFPASAAPPASYDAGPAADDNWLGGLPEVDFPEALALHQPNEYQADASWPHALPAHSLPDQQRSVYVSPADDHALPHHSRNLLTPAHLAPALRVTAHSSERPNFQREPQDPNYYSSTFVPSSSPIPTPQQARFGSTGAGAALPPNSRSLVPPTLRVTTHGFQEPQDTNSYYSPVPGSAASSISSHHEVVYFQNQHQSPYNTHLSPHLGPQNPFMTTEQRQDMISPPRSPHDQQQLSRKRSHSVMSRDGAPPQQPMSAESRSGSVASLQPHSPEDEYSSPRQRNFKRGEPPMNHDHKYICDFSDECAGLTFDRKCEWSKHMDKHDRPYRCQHASCAKLQGFTYSGGLLRHEREVHGKHGGPKSQLMCPHEDCKRHSGKGFTRKENLNEHIRRVHSSKDQQSQLNSLKREAPDALPGADEGETPASESMDQEDPTSPMRKRRRYTLGNSDRDASEDSEDWKQTAKRLEDENVRQREELKELPTLREELRELRELVRRLQQQQSSE